MMNTLTKAKLELCAVVLVTVGILGYGVKEDVRVAHGHVENIGEYYVYSSYHSDKNKLGGAKAFKEVFRVDKREDKYKLTTGEPFESKVNEKLFAEVNQWVGSEKYRELVSHGNSDEVSVVFMYLLKHESKLVGLDNVKGYTDLSVSKSNEADVKLVFNAGKKNELVIVVEDTPLLSYILRSFRF